MYVSSGLWSFKSPNFPNKYPPNSYCVWEIIDVRPSRMNLLSLRFRSFNIEYDYDCSYDSVTIYRDGSPGRRLCGQQHTSTTWFASRSFKVVFRSDDSEQYSGFKAVFWRRK